MHGDCWFLNAMLEHTGFSYKHQRETCLGAYYLVDLQGGNVWVDGDVLMRLREIPMEIWSQIRIRTSLRYSS